MKQRIMVKDGDITSTSAHVVEGQNRLLQKRSFAFEGRKWYYQPKKGQKFIPVQATEIPESVVNLMVEKTGLTVEQLRYPEL